MVRCTFWKIMKATIRRKNCRAKSGSKETHKMVVRACQDGAGLLEGLERCR